jgi:hypothetical protein
MKHIKRSMEPSTKYWFTHKHGFYMYIVNIFIVAIDHKKGTYNKKNKIFHNCYSLIKNK